MELDLILWLLSAISFGLGAASVPAGRVNWLCLGLMFAALTFVI
jgi:hypothetical protein